MVSDYFEVFGLEHKLDLDARDLEQRYYALSRRLHPDLRGSVDGMAALNDAYRTLKDPVRRAEYFLKQNGIATDVTADVLEEFFDLNVALEESRADPERLRDMREQSDRELAAAFQEYDKTADRTVLEEIGAILGRRKYLGRVMGTADERR